MLDPGFESPLLACLTLPTPEADKQGVKKSGGKSPLFHVPPSGDESGGHAVCKMAAECYSSLRRDKNDKPALATFGEGYRQKGVFATPQRAATTF